MISKIGSVVFFDRAKVTLIPYLLDQISNDLFVEA